jgi:hypothetical protein
VNNDDKCVYYKYKNGFGFESYSKREIKGGDEIKIDRKAFHALEKRKPYPKGHPMTLQQSTARGNISGF